MPGRFAILERKSTLGILMSCSSAKTGRLTNNVTDESLPFLRGEFRDPMVLTT